MKQSDSPVEHPVAAVIGDVVGSRSAADRQALHQQLTTTLSTIGKELPSQYPPTVTAGDEFQASYASIGAALQATFLIKVRLAGMVDVRFGIGWGSVEILDAAQLTQDGPAWWQARAAIATVEQRAQRPGTRHARFCYRADSDGDGSGTVAIEAALLCRDQLMGSLDMRSVRILQGLVAGQSRGDIAAAEKISPSAVSQRAHRSGLDVILDASMMLQEAG